MQHKQQQHFFSVTDLAEYEYCSLAWWHDHFEPLALADTEELFARLVELEELFDTQAPLQPEYQVIEQLLQRRGAFEQEHLQEPNSVSSSLPIQAPTLLAEGASHMRRLLIIALLILLLAILLVAAALVFR